MNSLKCFFILLFAAVMIAQTKPATDTAKPVSASIATQNKILRAQHELDAIQNKEKDSNVQFLQLQQQAQTLQQGYGQMQTQEAQLKKAVDAAIEDAWKESGLDKSKYDFDQANLTFTPKKANESAKK